MFLLNLCFYSLFPYIPNIRRKPSPPYHLPVLLFTSALIAFWRVAVSLAAAHGRATTKYQGRTVDNRINRVSREAQPVSQGFFYE